MTESGLPNNIRKLLIAFLSILCWMFKINAVYILCNMLQVWLHHCLVEGKVYAFQRGTSICWFPRGSLVGPFSIMVSCGHFLAYMQMLQVTPLYLYFVDFLFPFIHIISNPLLISTAYLSHTGLLAAVSLSHHH